MFGERAVRSDPNGHRSGAACSKSSGICLEENTVFIAEEHARLIKELEKRKANVVSGFRMDIASRWGGAGEGASSARAPPAPR